MSDLNFHLYLFFFLLQFALFSTSHVQALTSPSDISALKAFKASIKPSSIPSWSCLASWDFTTDPCTLPHRLHFTCGITCSPDSTRVTQITLDPAGYSGTLTPQISQLTHLSTLDLSENSFFGSIPSSISSLSSLQILTLRSNSFSGSLTPSITKLKSLESLDISHNSLSGFLPNSMASLSTLRRLDLSFNKITGSLPKLPPKLLELALKSNSLSGPLSNSSFDGLTQLEVVELSQNSFSGTLQSWFFLIPSLQQIDLANNSLTAVDITRPTSGGGGGELVAVDLSFNRIEGYAPANFAAFPRLSSLSVRYNRLRGKIPVEYGKNKSLKRLYLDGNFLNGQPPPALLTGSSGISGSLGDNCLQGCPSSAKLCLPSQKSNAICKQVYGGGRGRPRS
ncbi:leucine-rich repeat receptor-like serine/threonine-protein kinase BAM1 [Argentina anserina]|uniref:leucine-rich repeat receptor-like serine/threonine-protein kinase BAM1 n=1 Tax=Argentina anserina TaxID=57926 RepID=UPI0021767692|nr:leucine-rich repeat receptor-like serine/threonine-protein kinase BAM1 [Potentilla anserina]